MFPEKENRIITFKSGETENNKYRSSVKDVKAILGEETMSGHCLLLMDIVFKKKVRRKVKFRKKLKLWMLRESELKEEFAEGVKSKHNGN